ncbi:MAG: hypothetical protein HOJ35_04150 [Bdellovibrionales bacterium]|jgi:hypothetical protein|nr:hypothetical protein [Bdellovibrionales bacterium]
MKIYTIIILLIISSYSFADDNEYDLPPSLLFLNLDLLDDDSLILVSESDCSVSFLNGEPVVPTGLGLSDLIENIQDIGYKIKVYSNNNDRNEEVLALGIWTSNLTSLEFFKLDVDFLSGHELTGNIVLEYDNAEAILGYNYTVPHNGQLNLGVYATYDHSLFSPEGFSTGGRISYDTTIAGMNFSIFTFYKHIEDLRD